MSRNDKIARKLLPLLRNAVRLKVRTWEAERAMELLLDRDIDSSEWDGICIGIDGPGTAAEVKAKVTLEDACSLLCPDSDSYG